MSKLRTIAVTVVTGLAVAGLAVSAGATPVASGGANPPDPAATAAAAGLPRTGSSAVAAAGFAAGVLATGVDPTASPVGVDVAGCQLTAAHPRPVVLVNGTFTVMQDSFGYLGPRLARAGYCVFGYNYGAGDPQVQAVGPVLRGVTALSREVDRVVRTTRAPQVELVGYSQGGLISEYYTKFVGRAKVHSVTVIAPTTHGTTLLGIGAAGRYIPGALPALRSGGCAACADQVIGSEIVRTLNTGPVAVAGIPYTVIDTLYEDVVTPTGSSFIHEPGVVNEFVQDFDPTDVDEHVILPFNPTTGDRVLAALARAGS